MAAASIRDDLPIPPLIDARYFQQDLSIEKLAGDVRRFLANRKYDTLIVSSEHFSYFRTAPEIDRLRRILPGDHQVWAFLVLREREDFRVSYLRQTVKTGHGPTEEKTSPYYCGKDSWLLEDDKIIDLWTREVAALQVLDYSRNGIIRKLLAAMELPEDLLEEEVWTNATPSGAVRFLTRMKRITRSKSPYFYYVMAAAWGKGKVFFRRHRSAE
jgi:hypothetical protein